jgi:hypothetical protein
MALFVITIESRRCALRAAASVDSNVELPERCTRALARLLSAVWFDLTDDVFMVVLLLYNSPSTAS